MYFSQIAAQMLLVIYWQYAHDCRQLSN
jgi:hypothetical protein